MTTRTRKKKPCSHCGEEKLPGEYYLADKETGRRRAKCAACHREHAKKRADATRPERRKYAHDYYWANRELCLKRVRAYQEKKKGEKKQ